MRRFDAIAIAMTLLVIADRAHAQTGQITGTVGEPSQLPADHGELTLTPTGDPAKFKIHGYYAQGDATHTFDTTGTVAGNTITFQVEVTENNFINALDGKKGEKVMKTITYTIDPQKAAGTSTIDTKTGALVHDDKAPPGVDHAVAVAMNTTQEQADKLRAKVKQQFGVMPKRWLGYLTPPDGPDLAKAVRAAAADSHGKIDPTWLYTVAMGEGLLYVTKPEIKQLLKNMPFPILGFQLLGTDTFGSRVAGLKAGGYLPKSFTEGKDYKVSTHTNEKGETVKSADFKDLTAGLTALQAMLAQSQDQVLAEAKKIWGPDVKLTEDELRFWTYLDFNVGSGGLETFMKKHPPEWGLHRSGAERHDQKEAHYNGVLRVATARWLEDLGTFGAAPSQKAQSTTGMDAVRQATQQQANQPLGE